MKNIVYAIILSIIIHLLFFFTVEIKNDTNTLKNQKNSLKKQRITYVKLKPKKIVKKEIVTEKTVKKKKRTKYKKVIKKNIIKAKKRKTIKKPKRVVPKPIIKTIVKPTYTKPLPKKSKIIKKKRIQLPKKNKSLDQTAKKLQDKTLESFLLEPLDETLVDSVTQKYIDLYGEEFNTFTKVQKVFLKNHLKDIGLITQKYLKYPDVSIRTRQDGTNIVEFTLYPNGDISKVMLSSSSGYEALDKNSLRTVQIAFIEYPRPQKPTKIKIYITYIYY